MLSFLAFILLQINLFSPPADSISKPPNRIVEQKLDTIRIIPDTQQVTIEDIIIVGNNKTKDLIVLRELLIEANSLVNGKEFREMLERSRNNLFNTGLFHQVSVDYIPIGPRKVKIVVMLTERWYFWPFPIIELADRNINAWWLTKDFSRINFGLYLFKFNFRGKKETISLRFKYGFTRQIGLTYNIPYIDKKQRSGLNFSFAFSTNKQLIYNTLNNRIQFLKELDQFNRKEINTNITYTYRRKIYSYNALSLRYTFVNISDTLKHLNPLYLGNSIQSLQFFSLEYVYRYDRRDYRAYPLKGYYIELNASQHGLGILKREKINMQYAYLMARKYFKWSERWYTGTSLKTKISTGRFQPYYLQRGLGYQNDYVRGYEYYVIDGQNFGLLKANLKYNLVKTGAIKLKKIKNNSLNRIQYGFYLNAFADGAYVQDNQFNELNKLNNTFLHGYGIGLDFVGQNDLVIRFELTRNGLNQNGFYLHFSAPL